MILVEDGKPIERNLRRDRITLEELAAAGAAAGIADRSTTVRWAVLETNGQISFIPKGARSLRACRSI